MRMPPLDEDGKPKGGPVNRRAEMWMKSKEWLEQPGGVPVPDSDSLQADACGPGYKLRQPQPGPPRKERGRAGTRRR